MKHPLTWALNVPCDGSVLSHFIISYPFFRYDLLIWYLSLFDLSGIIIVIVDVYETSICYRHWPFGLLGCKTVYPLYYLSINMSVCVLLLITIDRYRCKRVITFYLSHPEILIRKLIRSSKTSGSIQNFDPQEFKETSYFNPDKNYIKKSHQEIS